MLTFAFMLKLCSVLTFANYAQFYARPICASLVVLVIWSETDHTNNVHVCMYATTEVPQISPRPCFLDFKVCFLSSFLQLLSFALFLLYRMPKTMLGRSLRMRNKLCPLKSSPSCNHDYCSSIVVYRSLKLNNLVEDHKLRLSNQLLVNTTGVPQNK